MLPDTSEFLSNPTFQTACVMLTNFFFWFVKVLRANFAHILTAARIREYMAFDDVSAPSLPAMEVHSNADKDFVHSLKMIALATTAVSCVVGFMIYQINLTLLVFYFAGIAIVGYLPGGIAFAALNHVEWSYKRTSLLVGITIQGMYLFYAAIFFSLVTWIFIH